MCGPAPSATVVSRSMNYKRAPRDQALRSQGSLNEGVLSRYARGGGLIASNARFGLIPLRCGFGWAPRDQSTLAGNVGTGGLSSAIALGGPGCRRSNARRGPIPLRCGFGWAPRVQSALAGNVGTGGAFQRYRAGGNRMSTFLCSLRPDTATLRFWVGSAGSGRKPSGRR